MSDGKLHYLDHHLMIRLFCLATKCDTRRDSIITSGRYDTEVINSSRIFSCFFSILCRAARVVEEPAEETTTSGK